METIVSGTSTLRPTSEHLLDLDRVKRLLDSIISGVKIDPIIAVGSSPNYRYIVKGHPEAYAAFIAGVEAETLLIQTDYEVASCRFGPALRCSTLKELIEACEMANLDSMQNRGIEMVADYALYQPLFTHHATHG